VIGVPLTIVARQIIASRLYDVAASDLATIGVTILTLAVVTAIAGVLPAYRAARIDPNSALRYD
jgi:ABC-type antimicrobial peptide transport system permease subunit